MSILPSVDISDFDSTVNLLSKTYSLDFNVGEIGSFVDGLTAIEQAIIKIINTSRFKHPIYSFNYGCEIQDLIGMDLTDGFLRSELERMIVEALEYDDRIDKVHSFDITTTGDNIYISFQVDTVEGVLTISEVINRV